MIAWNNFYLAIDKDKEYFTWNIILRIYLFGGKNIIDIQKYTYVLLKDCENFTKILLVLIGLDKSNDVIIIKILDIN